MTVRGMEPSWLRNLYGIALVPDAVFYLEVSPEHVVQRVFAKQSAPAKKPAAPKPVPSPKKATGARKKGG